MHDSNYLLELIQNLYFNIVDGVIGGDLNVSSDYLEEAKQVLIEEGLLEENE